MTENKNYIQIPDTTEPFVTNAELPSVPNGTPPDHAKPPKKRSKFAICAAGVLAVTLATGVFAFASGCGKAEEAPSDDQKQEQAVDDQKQAVTASKVKLTVAAEGWNSEATKSKIKVEGTSDDNKNVSDEHEIEPNKETDLDLADGTYRISVSQLPVLADGSTYVAPDPIEVKIEHGKDAASVDIKLTPVSTDALTAEELAANAEALAAAGNTGAADAVKNAAANHTKTAEAPAPVAPSVNGGSSNSNSGSNSSNGSSENSSHSEGAHSRECSHNWVEQTSQKWVSNIVWVEDSPAWNEPVYQYEEHEICNTCGADITGFANQHLLNSGRGGCTSWRSEMISVQVGSIPHDAVGHNEDRGHFEISSNGFKCSLCGQTK